MSASARDAGEPCEPLDWDSRFFGFSVARVLGDVMTPRRVADVDAWCRARSVSCLYFLARADQLETTRSAEDGGFRLVDIRMTFERSVRKDDPARFEAARLRTVRPDDLPHLKPIARVSYRDTRFHFDGNIPPELSDRLYEVWIEVSVTGWADSVLVLDDGDSPAGYITCHLHPERREGSIGLVGVSEQGRGRGYGRRLVDGALGWFASKGLQSVSVATQGRNIAAQRLYQQCGFVSRSVGLYYHKWYAPGRLAVD